MTDLEHSPIMVRDARATDMGDVLRIYTPYVLQGLATFEEVPPTLDEMLARRVAVLSAGLPYLIATRGDAVVGYTYVTAYRPRPAYRHTIENSVYVAYNRAGKAWVRPCSERLLLTARRDRRGRWWP
jgi:L-amino acid N-acyltransferase YncA